MPTFAFVSIGAGVGMGLVVAGELVRGAQGGAGEIGYLPSGRDPYDERHRLHGGLEDEIGAAGILAALRDRSGESSSRCTTCSRWRATVTTPRGPSCRTWPGAWGLRSRA